jgi:poly-beta-1,6-N-acetyl-D-glucosamine synthase
VETHQISVTLFWAALLFLLYTYIGYPLLIYVRRFWRRQPVRKDYKYSPLVSVLIVAYNEEKVIRLKLENALSLKYHGEPPEIVVASDGSCDKTNEIVREFQHRGVVLLQFPNRRGKTQVLNLAIPQCHGEIVVLSDSRQVYASNAIRELVANFNDPRIGAVSGNLQFHAFPDSKDGEQIGLYWRYEKWIRRLQSEIDSSPVVTGAIYAIRKSLFRPLPVKCIADDLAMPMSIIMQNYRVTFDQTAKAFDHYSRTLKEEFRRRVRTIAGSYQYLVHVPKVLNPNANRIWLDFISHKVCRILAPFGLLILLITNGLITNWVYRLFLALQLTFYLIAVLGAILARRGEVPRMLSGPYTFLMLNVAASVALFKLLWGTQTHLWEKTKSET